MMTFCPQCGKRTSIPKRILEERMKKNIQSHYYFLRPHQKLKEYTPLIKQKNEESEKVDPDYYSLNLGKENKELLDSLKEYFKKKE